MTGFFLYPVIYYSDICDITEDDSHIEKICRTKAPTMRHPSALPMAIGETHKELVQFADARATVVGRQNWCCLFWSQREGGLGH